jgi:AcrR family transcriptional regulator
MASEHRDAILTAATDAFARFGFKKTSIDDIARRARIGKGTVYLHFEGKEQLFGAVIRRIWVKALADLEAGVKQARTPPAKVRAFLEGRQRGFMQMAADLRIAPGSLAELMVEAEPHRGEPRAREAALLEEIIKDGNAQGVFAVRSPRLVAAGMTACLHGLDVHLVGAGGGELSTALAELYEVFVRGLLAAPRHTRTSEA